MGVRAFLQRGRTTHGLVLPAKALATLNDAQDHKTHEKWLDEGEAPGTANVQKVTPAETKAAAGPTAPVANQEPASKENPASPAASGGGGGGGPDNFSMMNGVGEALENHLYEAGYTTFESMAEAKPAELSEKVHGVSEGSAKDMIGQAKKLAKKKAAGKL